MMQQAMDLPMDFGLWVPGMPVPQGSKKGFVVGGRAVLVDQNVSSLSAYRADIREAYLRAESLPTPAQGAVRLDIIFTFPHPKTHLDSKGRVKARVKVQKSTSPDIDKLTRAVLDALTGLFYFNDAQVAELHVRKEWGEAAMTAILGVYL